MFYLSIIIKKIGKREYAYFAERQGDKVVQKYIGPFLDPKVQNKIKKFKEEKKVPALFYHLFWDVNPLKVDLKKNRRYIIERVLELGDINALQWLENIYPTKLILETCETSRKIYKRSKNLWLIWFGISNEQ